MHRLALSFVAVFAVVISCAQFAAADDVCVASWNVENLFDLEDDPNVEFDEDFTPEAPNRWTKERLDIKLNNLASILSKINDGKGPDVLGLCEVENRKVVEMLVEMLAPLGRKYEIVHKDSDSDRGIDTALIYDAGEFKLEDSKFHYVEAEKTRDVVEAKLRRLQEGGVGDVLYVFVNHWPSRRNDEWQRLAAAKVLRARVDEILAADPQADIVMVGDYNDEPFNASLKETLKAATSSENLPEGALFDATAFLVDESKGTFVWDEKWQLIDHIIVSPGLLDEEGFALKKGSSQRLEYPELFYQGSWPGAIPRPSKSYSQNDFHKDGYSDHLALICILSDL
jgi:predicted extracellular nuclease